MLKQGTPKGILFPYSGESFGGSYVSSLLLVKALQKAGYDVTIGLHSEGVLTEYLDQVGLSLKKLPSIETYSGFVRLQTNLVSLTRFLKDNHIRIVHTNDRRMHSAWVLAARLGGANHVWHQRNSMTSRKGNLQASLSSSIISVSNYCKNSLHPWNQRKSVVISNPVECEADPDHVVKARAELLGGSALPHTKIIGFFASWEKRKRPGFFVEIAGRLSATRDRPLIFALFGEPRAEMKDAVVSKIESLGLQGSVRLIGQKIPVEPWIAACDFVVAPALHEGMGRVLVEAMQLRSVVVASADGGHLEIVEHARTGVLFPPEDPDACVRQIRYLLDHEHEYLKMVDSAERYSRKMFSVERHANAIIRVYESLW